MGFYSQPPDLREFKHDKPSLLVCWWVTIFCATMVLFRVAGRFIRSERLFKEDCIAATATIPLFLRMGCVHYVLIHGTNNADFSDVLLTTTVIKQKQIASGLVLLSRFLFTLTLWIFKCAILEFLNRLTGLAWNSIHHGALLFIRWTVVVTFVGTVISDLTECRPFRDYWQVSPQVSGQCRQGYVWLIVMGSCSVVTDIMLVVFPCVIVLRSHMKVTRKIQLLFLFSLSLGVVGVTLYRIPHVIWAHGRQQTRSLLASVELLFATTAANALVLGSFVRDRGVKKAKFHPGSATETLDSAPKGPGTMMTRQWGSDEDLVRDMGMNLDPELRDRRPLSLTAGNFKVASAAESVFGRDLTYIYPPKTSSSMERSEIESAEGSGNGRSSFFDVGGLLEQEMGINSIDFGAEPFVDRTTIPAQAHNAGAGGFRRGSQAVLQDIGSFLATSALKMKPSPPSENSDNAQASPSRFEKDEKEKDEKGFPHEPDDMVIMDPGGLLK